jgi:hypothetical protein
MEETPMKRRRIAIAALLLGAVSVVISCSETSPVGPASQGATAKHDLLGGLTQPLKTLGLLKCNPMPEYRVTQVIGPSGGAMQIGPHTFSVPAGALSSNVTITADAPHDNVNRVVFSPEGLTFATPATLTMSYANCNLLGSLLPKHIAYVDDNLNILYYLLGSDNLLTQQVSGQVSHFSDYATAW